MQWIKGAFIQEVSKQQWQDVSFVRLPRQPEYGMSTSSEWITSWVDTLTLKHAHRLVQQPNSNSIFLLDVQHVSVQYFLAINTNMNLIMAAHRKRGHRQSRLDSSSGELECAVHPQSYTAVHSWKHTVSWMNLFAGNRSLVSCTVSLWVCFLIWSRINWLFKELQDVTSG